MSRPPPEHWIPPFLRFSRDALPALPAIVDDDARARVFVHKSVFPVREQLAVDPAIRKVAELDCNQRLEWLGDALLEWLVSEELIVLFPRANQGDLDQLRKMVTANRTLSHLAWQYGFDEKLRHNLYQSPASASEDKRAVREQKVFADAFEAYLAGVAQPPRSHERVDLVRDYLHRLLSPSCAADLWTAADQIAQLKSGTKDAVPVNARMEESVIGPHLLKLGATARVVTPSERSSRRSDEKIQWIEKVKGGSWEIRVQISGQDILAVTATKRNDAIQQASIALLERLQQHPPSLTYLSQDIVPPLSSTT